MGSAGDTIMYLWHDVPGLQKFGSYTGNANADGVYVCLLYTSPSPRDKRQSRMPSSA